VNHYISEGSAAADLRGGGDFKFTASSPADPFWI